MIYIGPQEKVKFIANVKENSTEELSFARQVIENLLKKYSLNFKVPTVVKVNPNEFEDLVLHNKVCVSLGDQSLVVDNEFDKETVKSLKKLKRENYFFNEILENVYDTTLYIKWDSNSGYTITIINEKIHNLFKINNSCFFRELNNLVASEFSTGMKECTIGYNSISNEFTLLNLSIRSNYDKDSVVISHPLVDTKVQPMNKKEIDYGLISKYILYVLKEENHANKGISDINYFYACDVVNSLSTIVDKEKLLSILKELVSSEKETFIQNKVKTISPNDELKIFDTNLLSSYLEEFVISDEEIENIKNIIEQATIEKLETTKKYVIENMKFRINGERIRIQLKSTELIDIVKINNFALVNKKQTGILTTEFDIQTSYLKKLENNPKIKFNLTSNANTTAKYASLLFDNDTKDFYTLGINKEKIPVCNISEIGSLKDKYAVETKNNES